MAGLPAYMHIRQYVNDLMMNHGDKELRIMSERELCRKFEVTRPTARKALKELIDEGYLYIKPGVGTFVNPGQVMNHTFVYRKAYTVMVVFGGGRHTDLDGFTMNILARICDRLKHLPIRLRIANVNAVNKDLALKEVEMYNPDGILWFRPTGFANDVIDIVREKIPVNIIGNVPNGDKYSVTADYFEAGRLAASWFLEHGRKKAAFVGSTPAVAVRNEVFRGWQAEFVERGMVYDMHLQINIEDNILERTIALLDSNSIDGIFSFGSEFAAVDFAFVQTGADAEKYPVMFDENYYGEYGARTVPAAKLMMLPEEAPMLAAENLFRALDEPNFVPKEIVSAPEIEEN